MNEKNALDFDQTIIQGDRYVRNFRLEDADQNPMDLTGYGVRGQIRTTPASGDAVDFTASLINAAGGEISLSLTPGETAGLTPGINAYDVELYNLTDADDVIKILKGRIRVRAEVTR